MHQRITCEAAVADAQYELPHAMTVDATAVPHAPDGGGIENLWDLRTKCPAVTKSSSSSSSSSSTKTSTTSVSKPSPSPYEQGDPRTNTVKCYNSGETTEDVRMQNEASSFCGDIENNKLVPGYFRSVDLPFPCNGGAGTVTITISMQLKSGCGLDWNHTLCEKYLSVLADSCNCAGVNGKQGGILENNCYKMRVDPNRSL